MGKKSLIVTILAAGVVLVAAFSFMRLGTPEAPAPLAPSVATAAPTDAVASPGATADAATPALPEAVSPLEMPASPLASPLAPALPVVYDYVVRTTFPHDPAAFTQGLVYHEGEFYEGTGLYGQSSLRRVALESGDVLQQHDLAEELFGEGIAVLGDKIYQLTWQNGIAFVYDRTSFELLQQFTYPTEGWGLTHDGQQLIMSDGTAVIYFRDPIDFQETRRITVTLEGEPLPQLNELEYVDGKILANVWQTDFVVRIDPTTGVVDGVYDFRGLLAQAPPAATVPDAPPDVLNGIAYDAASGRLFITGKRWPALFEVTLTPRP